MKKKKKKLLEKQRKLLKQKNEQDKILKQQIDEQKKMIEEQKKMIEEQEEENILRNMTFENINKVPIAEFRPSFSRKAIKKPTSSPSKISAPITKSREPQGVAIGEQASVAIMENKLEASKNYIEYLKKELDNTEFLLEKALEIGGKIIQKEDKVRELEKEILEHKEDIERRFRKYYPDKYYSYKK